MNSKLKNLFGDRYKDDELTRTAWASAACFYRYVPKAVVFPKNTDEMVSLFEYACMHHENLTFRAAGTSLSGQAVTDGILVDCSRFWKKTNIKDNGHEIWFEPGVVAKHLNHLLKPYGRKIGPDPASIDSCRMGGVLANNASGMCCGVAHNSYHTLQNIQFVLPCGAQYDTREKGDYDRFLSEQSVLSEKLLALQKQILANETLKNKIQNKFRIKNTMGYALNALLDFSHPLDIFSHLLIGSEGTLGFIASASLKTIPAHPFVVTAMFYFADIDAACLAIPQLKLTSPSALELMDNACLAAVLNHPNVPDAVRHLPHGSAALLVEWSQESTEARQKVFHKISHLSLTTIGSQITIDSDEQHMLWNVRKGIFPAVGAKRPPGATVVIEDVCVAQHHLADAIKHLRLLLSRYGYHDSAIFGHANDGNLHFVMNVSLDNPSSLKNYENFMNEVSQLIVDHFDGSLKAEHGTGRNMAPFVKKEWGQEAYDIMRAIKQTTDPHNILNRDVLLSDNEKIHVTKIKDFPQTHPLIDGCIECGFCEIKCPSQGFTLSPRQRIVTARELRRRSERDAKQLVSSFQFAGIETCAADGMCATTCPVQIDTGAYIKILRGLSLSRFQQRVALWVAQYFKAVLWIVRTFGPLMRPFLQNIPPFRRRALSFRSNFLSQSSSYPNLVESPYLYFPSCLIRSFAEPPSKTVKSVDEAFFILCKRANVTVSTLKNSLQLCCAMPFESKGYSEAQKFKEQELLQAFTEAATRSNETLKVVIDTSTCSHRLKQLIRNSQLNIQILDLSEFLRDVLLPKLLVTKKLSSVALHPGCGAAKAALLPAIKAVADMCANQVYISPRTGCCGSAGDKGMRIPALVANALAEQAADIKQSGAKACYGTNLVCQASLSRHTGREFLSLVHLVLEATSL